MNEYKKKILIISTVPTHPTIAGNRSAILSYSQLLRNMGCHVSFLLVSTSNNQHEEEITKSFWGDNFFLYKPGKLFFKKKKFARYLFDIYKNSHNVDSWYPNGLEHFVEKLQQIHHFDIIIINYIWLTKLFNHLNDVKKILFTHDVFSYRYERLGIKTFSVTPNEEAKALDRCDTILAIQDLEKIYFNFLTSKKVITAYSPVEFHSTQICNNNDLLFLAGPNNHNTSGIIYFIDNIWPKLKVEFADLRLLVGGRICSRKEIINKKRDDILLIGEVNDLMDFYSKADIFINPVFEGTGLKIKNMEAAAYEKIVICHPHNTEGIFNKDNAPIFKAEDADEYIAVLKNLFGSREKILEGKKKIKMYIVEYNDMVRSRFLEALY